METDVLRDPRQRVVGTRETLKKISQNKAVRVYVAQDADAKMVAEVVKATQTRGVPLGYIDSMTELGRLCGIQVGAACATVIAPKPANPKEGG
ncbi:MAG: ribosomal L7Ae/L30e/S12e/Gadd45 family protein [Firmicutes bacterium]|jgi:large subunit ribosomal protein L7A|nr:ribosomal L7Ae/L30e/S12e/Gadd45 family protein [Bacillota bacterium]